MNKELLSKYVELENLMIHAGVIILNQQVDFYLIR